MNRNRLILLLFVLVVETATWAQNGRRIRIINFENSNSVITSPTPIVDRNGTPCAVIRFYSDDMNYVIEPNMGKLKADTLIGEIRMWVPKDTKLITIRHEGTYPLVNYKIPIRIESKHVYVATIEMTGNPSDLASKPLSDSKAPSLSNPFYIGAGYSILSIMGPTASAGFMYKGFTIEAGAVYGLGKSKDVYIYNKGGDLQDAYNYSALRAFLHLGYDLWAAEVFALTPQIGAAFTSVKGSRLSGVNASSQVLDGATAISATLGLRLMFAPSGKTKPLRLFLTPEYDLAVSKDKNFEALSNYDSKIKSWADGLNLSVGLLFYF